MLPARLCLPSGCGAIFVAAANTLPNTFFTSLLQYGGENTGFCFAFDEPLSHLIYAGQCSAQVAAAAVSCLEAECLCVTACGHALS